jgi:hypothetical protein
MLPGIWVTSVPLHSGLPRSPESVNPIVRNTKSPFEVLARFKKHRLPECPLTDVTRIPPHLDIICCCTTHCQTPRETNPKATWRAISDLSWPRCMWSWCVCLSALFSFLLTRFVFVWLPEYSEEPRPKLCGSLGTADGQELIADSNTERMHNGNGTAWNGASRLHVNSKMDTRAAWHGMKTSIEGHHKSADPPMGITET